MKFHQPETRGLSLLIDPTLLLSDSWPRHGTVSLRSTLVSLPVDVASLGLSRALIGLLQANGIRTVDELCQRNARELLDLPRVGKGTLATIEAGLEAHGRQLSVDPWAPY